jgi:hypothetical protein
MHETTLTILDKINAPAYGQRLRYHNASRIYRLEYASEVHQSRHFFDQHWRQALGPQPFMNAKEVDFCGEKDTGKR